MNTRRNRTKIGDIESSSRGASFDDLFARPHNCVRASVRGAAHFHMVAGRTATTREASALASA